MFDRQNEQVPLTNGPGDGGPIAMVSVAGRGRGWAGIYWEARKSPVEAGLV